MSCPYLTHTVCTMEASLQSDLLDTTICKLNIEVREVSKVETKEELFSTVERLWRSPIATERSTGADWNQET